MDYLIDTQIIIWSIISPEKLKPNVRKILEENQIWVSQISFIEIAIKQKVQKLPEFQIQIDELIFQLNLDGFQILNLKNEHILNYAHIPLFPEHRDPFDRLLISTSFSEKMPIISSDENFKLYQNIITLVEN